MKKYIAVIALSLSILAMGLPAHSSTITVDVEGLDTLSPDGIWAYSVTFDVLGGTDWFTAGSVTFAAGQGALWTIPGTADASVASGDLVVINNDPSFGGDLLDIGDIFTVTYPDIGVTLSVLAEFFLLGSDLVTPVEMFLIPSGAVFGAGDHTLTFTPVNPVPIPGSILLLGSGLIGLIGLVRRKRS